MSQGQARAWWADVEHLREAAERRQAAEARRRAAERRARARRETADGGEAQPLTRDAARARARAASRVRAEAGGAVDELTARRAVALDERTPRPRRPVPIWLAEDPPVDPVAAARARAAAPRRTIEIRGQVGLLDAPPRRVADAGAPTEVPSAQVVAARRRASARRAEGRLAASFAAHPDRVAFWAFALGLLLALAAATSSHAAVL